MWPALAAYRQFVCWIAVPSDSKPGKLEKLPVHHATGRVVSAHDPAGWTDHATAAAAAPQWNRGHGSGVGFSFTAGDPFYFIDVDGALVGGQWSPLAQRLCAEHAGAAVEVSQSGTGLHIIGSYQGVQPAHTCRNIPLGLELYTSGRFVALTGTHAQGDPAHDGTAPLAASIAELFPPAATGAATDWTSEPDAEWSGPDDDDELLRRARAAAARSPAGAFGGEPTIADMLDGATDVLARKWPGDPYDASAVDMAFANQLAFWTGKNCDRMERIMRASALARPKWDTHRTFLADTILKACGFTRGVYKERSLPAPQAQGLVQQSASTIDAPPPTALLPVNDGGAFRDPSTEYVHAVEQPAFFSGCWFLLESSKIYCLSRNAIYSKSSFDVLYGGHIFPLAANPTAADMTKSAFEAFTQSRVVPPVIVDDVCFRPELAPGTVVSEGGRTEVNSYVPYVAPSAPGDVTLMLDHIALMLPDAHDREILYNYIASFVQNPGVKFRYWPVIQGEKGNGKTLIIEMITYIIGEQYTHLPNAHAMARSGNQFNGWVHRKLFLGIEEIDLSHRRDILEELKTLVTNKRMSMEKKGVDQDTRDNRANGLICTNHKGGIPIDPNERRYAVFYTAQQSLEDIERDGMDDAYFQRLTGWLHTGGGMQALAHFFRTYPVRAELDPRNLARAPKTSSWNEALEHGHGRAELEILEAAAEGRPGFAGGWISSLMMGRMLRDMRPSANVSHALRKKMMESLGYVRHPMLVDGRVNDPVAPDNGKPVLYIKRDHPMLDLHSPGDVARAYSAAQQAPVIAEAARVFAVAPAPAPR